MTQVSLITSNPVISGRMGYGANNTTLGLIPFTVFNTQRGITYNSGTKRFTVPNSGMYLVMFNAFSNAAGTEVLLGVNTDTPNSSTCFARGYTGAYTTQLPVTNIVSLVANDYLVFTLVGGSLLDVDPRNHFYIAQIG